MKRVRVSRDKYVEYDPNDQREIGLVMVREYVRHKTYCDVFRFDLERCNCGLNEIVNDLTKAKKVARKSKGESE